MSETPAEKKLEVDDDWKAQAQQEKQRLAGQDKPPAAPGPAPQPDAAAGAPESGGRPPAAPLPAPTFELLVEQYVTQVLLALGAIAHPATGKRMRDMELAKHYIDLLSVLEAKTKGNLTKQEEDLLSTALYQMRMNYVNTARAGR